MLWPLGVPTLDQHKLNCSAKVIDNNRLIQRITTLICVELAECEGCFRCRYQIGAAAKVQEAKEKKKWLQFSLIRLSFCNWHLSSFSIHINCLISSSSYLISFFTSIPISGQCFAISRKRSFQYCRMFSLFLLVSFHHQLCLCTQCVQISKSRLIFFQPMNLFPVKKY